MASPGRRRAQVHGSVAGSGRRRAQVPRSRAPLLLVIVALLGIGATVAATALVGPERDGTGGDPERAASGPRSAGADDEDDSSAASAQPSKTPSAEVDLSNLPIDRELPECTPLDGDPVREALGAPVTVRRHYLSGDRVEVSPGVTDVVAEDGCVFLSPRADARVWVFSAPVGTTYARTLVRRARQAPGCTRQPDRTGFGDPTLTDVCTTEEGGEEAVTATLRGLFGDAWLTCRLSAEDEPEAAVLDRAEQWCTEVAVTLGAQA